MWLSQSDYSHAIMPFPLDEKSMKKLIGSNLLWSGLLILLSACAGAASTPTHPPTATLSPTRALSATPSSPPTRTTVPSATPSPEPTLIPRPTLADEGLVDFSILHINDFHGQVLFHETEFGVPPEGGDRFPGDISATGAARLAFFVKSYREKVGAESMLLLDAGDLIQASPDANDSQGQVVLDVINQIGFQAGMAGNHEFFFVESRFLEIAEQQKAGGFQFLAANISARKPNSSRCQPNLILPPYLIFDLGKDPGPKVRVAVIGLANQSYPEWGFDNESLCISSSPLAALKEYYPKLKDQEFADIIVVLSHQGYDEDMALAKAATQQNTPVDLIIGGHSHTYLDQPGLVGATYIVQVGEYGKRVGIFDLTFNRATKKLDVAWKTEDIKTSTPEDPQTVQFLQTALPAAQP